MKLHTFLVVVTLFISTANAVDSSIGSSGISKVNAQAYSPIKELNRNLFGYLEFPNRKTTNVPYEEFETSDTESDDDLDDLDDLNDLDDYDEEDTAVSTRTPNYKIISSLLGEMVSVDRIFRAVTGQQYRSHLSNDNRINAAVSVATDKVRYAISKSYLRFVAEGMNLEKASRIKGSLMTFTSSVSGMLDNILSKSPVTSAIIGSSLRSHSSRFSGRNRNFNIGIGMNLWKNVCSFSSKSFANISPIIDKTICNLAKKTQVNEEGYDAIELKDAITKRDEEGNTENDNLVNEVLSLYESTFNVSNEDLDVKTAIGELIDNDAEISTETDVESDSETTLKLETNSLEEELFGTEISNTEIIINRIITIVKYIFLAPLFIPAFIVIFVSLIIRIIFELLPLDRLMHQDGEDALNESNPEDYIPTPEFNIHTARQYSYPRFASGRSSAFNLF